MSVSWEVSKGNNKREVQRSPKEVLHLRSNKHLLKTCFERAMAQLNI